MIRAIALIDCQAGLLDPLEVMIPDDKRYFKQVTDRAIVVMGRRTYETDFPSPLPNRRNVVISSHLQQLRPGFELIRDLPRFLRTISEDIWIIGGGELYKTALAVCDELYLTRVNADFGCQHFFPDYETDFVLRSETVVEHYADLAYTFTVYARKNRQN